MCIKMSNNKILLTFTEVLWSKYAWKSTSTKTQKLKKWKSNYQEIFLFCWKLSCYKLLTFQMPCAKKKEHKLLEGLLDISQ